MGHIGSSLILVGLVTFINFIIIKIKIEKNRWYDAVIDIGFMIILGSMFFGSTGGAIIAMVASMAMSIYLWFDKPSVDKIDGATTAKQKILHLATKKTRKIR